MPGSAAGRAVAATSSKELAGADYDAHLPAKRAAERYDSVYARRGRAVVFDEYAVFNPDCVLPRYIVHFRRSGVNSPGATAMQKVEPTRRVGPVCFYEVTAEMVRAAGAGLTAKGGGSFLIDEFCRLQTYFMHLSEGLGIRGRLTKVVVCVNPELEARFLNAQRALNKRGLPADDQFAFHGTRTADTIHAIQLGGFKIGGLDGTAVAHGTVHGYGIYTGVTADVSAGYAGEQKAMLVVRVLPGKGSPTPLDVRQVSIDDTAVLRHPYQSHTARGFALILASPHLVLPKYVVHWE